ncbi:MAG TPA: DUF4214 domain-containing protein [Pirellulales bacterium]|nr:DUF4214 domain-containing protein [Pirellulales bacterium]
MHNIDPAKTLFHSFSERLRNRRQRHRCAILEGLEPRTMLSAVPAPAHVVIVMEENHDYSQIIGPAGSQNQTNAPYINSLALQGALMTNSTAITHPSEPNYLDLFSGGNQGIQSGVTLTNGSTSGGDELPTQFPGVTLPFTTPNLGAELMNAGDSFVSYSETLPSAGYDSLDVATQGNSGNYARRHNPAVNWTDPNNPNGNLASNVMPTSVNQPFSSFPTDYSKLPTVSLVVPNVQDDMHDGTIQQADTWLKNNLDGYVQWAKTNNSLFIVTWDENDTSAGNHIATIFDGPMIKSGQYNEAINHYNVLRTVEDLYNLPAAGSSATAASITDIFLPAISGSGATVTATAGNVVAGTLATFTDADGDTNPADFKATIDWGDKSAVTTVSGSSITGVGATFSVAGSHTYAQGGNYTLTITISDTDGATGSINASAVVPTAHQRYVTAVYNDVLSRAPDPSGLQFWSQLLDSGTQISAVAHSIANSAEYYANFVIKPAYLSLLGRAADDAGVTYWVQQMQNGRTDQQIQAGFISSDEFYASAGGTDKAWVDAVYLKLLGRPADPGGESNWLGELSSGVSRSQVALAIANSAENESDLITADYQHYLGRAPDGGGLSFWLKQFAAGQTNEDVIAGFTGSTEYYDEHTR